MRNHDVDIAPVQSLLHRRGRRPLDAELELETILDSFGEGFYSVDRDWRIRRYNPQASRHFGRPAQAMVGRKLWDIYPKAIETELGRTFFNTMVRRETLHSETLSVLVGPRWLDYRLFPLGDGMGIAFRDITDRKKMEQGGDLASAEMGAAVLDELSFGIVQLTARGHVLSANRAAHRIVGGEDGLFIQTTLRATFGLDDARLQAAVSRACTARNTGGQTGEHLHVSRLSARRPYVVFVVPLGTDRFHPRLPCAMAVIIDPDVQPSINEEKLMAVFGFTPAEARVVALLVSGQALPDIAKAVGIGFETARTHLAHARAKTDTASQLDLVRMVLTTVAPLSLMSS